MVEVTDALILAGGRGTRMLPASLYMPKEALPLVDTPILNHLIWEAGRAGANRVHLVLSGRKRELLSGVLEDTGPSYEDVGRELPRVALSPLSDGVEVLIHVQQSPGGVADAIASALHEVEGPFLVLLGDNLLIRDHSGPALSGTQYASTACLEMVERYNMTGLPSAAVLAVPEDDLCKYGVVDLDGSLIRSIVEKPAPSDSTSRYVLCGRYLLPGNTAEIMDLYPGSVHGELQSIALLRHIIGNGGLEAVKLEGYELYDSGDPVTWLKSQVDHALRREDISGDFKGWLRARLED